MDVTVKDQKEFDAEVKKGMAKTIIVKADGTVRINKPIGTVKIRVMGSTILILQTAIEVFARDKCVVLAYNKSMVWGYDSSNIIAYDSAYVQAFDDSVVTLCDTASADAFDRSRILAKDSSYICAFDKSKICPRGWENDQVVVNIFDKNVKIFSPKELNNTKIIDSTYSYMKKKSVLEFLTTAY